LLVFSVNKKIMKRILVALTGLFFVSALLTSCSQDELKSSGAGSLSTTQVNVAQTSGQLASGTSFTILGSSTDSTGTSQGDDHHHDPHHGEHGHGQCPGLLDGVNLLAPTNELLAIIDAESAGDFRGFRISERGGAAITHYNAKDETVSLIPPPDGPQGCSMSGKQFPGMDSLLATIVKTEIDFGAGVIFKHDTVSITRAGKIVITRSGDKNNLTEVIAFENYSVNGITIEGTKMRVTTVDATTGVSTSVTSVSNGVITFSDGTVANWTSDKTRVASITFDANTKKPVSGAITTEVNTSVKTADGVVIYSHRTTLPLTENVACARRRHGPVSGMLETIYRNDTLIVDYGDGSCNNQTITITLNGVTTTKTIGG
jgi:hypothetical protein